MRWLSCLFAVILLEVLADRYEIMNDCITEMTLVLCVYAAPAIHDKQHYCMH